MSHPYRFVLLNTDCTFISPVPGSGVSFKILMKRSSDTVERIVNLGLNLSLNSTPVPGWVLAVLHNSLQNSLSSSPASVLAPLFISVVKYPTGTTHGRKFDF